MAKLYTEQDVHALLIPLQTKITQLEEIIVQLQKNSSNSSKPPSSDIVKPKSKNHNKGKRKIGAQPGHPKHERPPFPEADITKFHDYRLSEMQNKVHPWVGFAIRGAFIPHTQPKDFLSEQCDFLPVNGYPFFSLTITFVFFRLHSINRINRHVLIFCD